MPQHKTVARISTPGRLRKAAAGAGVGKAVKQYPFRRRADADDKAEK